MRSHKVSLELFFMLLKMWEFEAFSVQFIDINHIVNDQMSFEGSPV